jgi:hypothetical protein
MPFSVGLCGFASTESHGRRKKIYKEGRKAGKE